MTVAEWARLVRPFLGERWAVNGRLAYVRPADDQHVLTGVLAERSSRDGFYLWQVRLPLYGPPSEVVVLNWSDRVGGASRTYLARDPGTGPVLKDAMDRALIENALGDVLVDPPGGVDNGSMQEVRGYGLLLLGDPSGAVECLGRVERSQIRADWQRELVVRAGEMRERIEAGETSSVLRRMRGWRGETLANLGLEAA